MSRHRKQEMSQARRVLYACALLRKAGCRILAASANNRPCIRVDRRPSLRWLEVGAKVTAPQYGVIATHLDDIQVEWTERRVLQ